MKTEKDNSWSDVFRFGLGCLLAVGIVAGVSVVNGIVMTTLVNNGNPELALLCLVGTLGILIFVYGHLKLAANESERKRRELQNTEKPSTQTSKKIEGYYVGDTYLERYPDDE